MGTNGSASHGNSSGMFSKEALESVVQRTLIAIPEDAHLAFMTVVNQDGVKAVIAVKVSDNWTVQSWVEVDKNAIGRKVSYGVEVHGFL